MNRTSVTVLIILLLMLFATACKSDQDVTNIDEDIVEEVEIEGPIDSEDEEFEFVAPLTGLGTNENIDYRPLGVMIENSRSARPQSGIDQADLVYEVLSEGTITRLLAFFHSEKPEIIGPVRSARDYYIHLNNGYNGLYVSAGGSPGAFAMIQRGQVDHISGLTYDGKYFYRSKERKAPHNLYTSYDSILDAANHAHFSMDKELFPLLFIDEEEFEASDIVANKVDINYGSEINNVSYEYDPETKSYFRFNGGEQTIDAETDSPVTVKNLLIVEAAHRVIDDVGRREVNLQSGGKAYLIQHGTAKPVEWENKDGRILPVLNGEEIGFLPGKTWVNFVQTKPSIDESVTIYE
ncbi:DUF3048 domain-containing protein [Anaerobacillus sp. MEB173]|uniref:DUF3048 domain-containing protein n=1 Tax=Anaerobacillus sp. MEB173 TaxID=3383345 RepID=UPI003F8DEF10